MNGREISDARECANVRVVPTCKRACNVNVTDDDEEKEEEEEEDEEAVRDSNYLTTSPLYGQAGNNGHGTIVTAIMGGHDKLAVRLLSRSEREKDVICDDHLYYTFVTLQLSQSHRCVILARRF
ncbi:hypothetical protein ALC53_11506 [Atta colombica]|uniref:Uncharacterized protein n=1 Tax=Atta colombica TaxID=520822 RepID=A0A195B1G2_9HYME|nr:hypothetical protein ALC53_11506 [Atta colombica]